MSPFRPAAVAAALFVSVSPYGALAQASATATPIEHVIVIVGENHTFENIFATYLPRPGQTISNLRSQDIVDDEGLPGRNFSLARQRTANSNGAYSLNPLRKPAYSKLPQPDTTYATGQPVISPTRAFPPICPTARSRSRATQPIAISRVIRCIAFFRRGNRWATTTKRICLSGSPRRQVSATTMTASARPPTIPTRVVWRWVSTI